MRYLALNHLDSTVKLQHSKLDKLGAGIAFIASAEKVVDIVHCTDSGSAIY